jgi:hypothetical protein
MKTFWRRPETALFRYTQSAWGPFCDKPPNSMERPVCSNEWIGRRWKASSWRSPRSPVDDCILPGALSIYQPRTTTSWENLRVRYVITYKSTNQGSLNARRTVRVQLVDPKSGKPLQILDANGKVIHANVVVQDSYTPNKASESTAK